MKSRFAAIVAAAALASCQFHRPGSTGSAERAGEGTVPRELPNGNASVNGPVLSYAPIVRVVAPAVVTVRASHRVQQQQQFPFFDEPFFRQFFGGALPRGGSSEVEEALGSGVVVRPDGHILTNQHVIDGAQDIKVDLNTDPRRTYSATLVGADAPSDLAVLKINASNLPVLGLSNSDQVRVGDICLAVGNPLGIGESVSSGIISAKGRATGLSNGNFQDFLQTDAPINRGNSGGALVNTRGELIGITSQILSSSGGSMGIGFAIPSNMARAVMDQLISKGNVSRGMLGVGVQTVTANLAQSLGMQQPHGVMVNSVTPGGPAAKAGLKTGDIILEMNGQPVNDPNILRNEVAGSAPGSPVTLTILRNGAQQQVQVQLGTWTPQAEAGIAPSSQPGAGGTNGQGGNGGPHLGLAVVPMTSDLAAQIGVPPNTQGVVVETVNPDGPAAQAGIQTGDIIQQVNHQPVRSAADLKGALARSGNRPPLLLVNRGGQTIFVAVPLQ
jgi:serine protease Do